MDISAGNTTGKSPYQLRMKPLPKPEYRLMRALIKQYDLKDESELFGVALRLLHEVSHYKHGEGLTWIYQVIDSYRSLPDTTRHTDYTPQ